MLDSLIKNKDAFLSKRLRTLDKTIKVLDSFQGWEILMPMENGKNRIAYLLTALILAD
jgi:hypothetical protein